MNTNQLTIESLASDLKRVVLGLQRGSVTMAERFLEEAEKRKQEVDFINLPDYIIEIIQKATILDIKGDRNQAAEDCLMYSILLQNFSRKINENKITFKNSGDGYDRNRGS